MNKNVNVCVLNEVESDGKQPDTKQGRIKTPHLKIFAFKKTQTKQINSNCHQLIASWTI